MTLRDRRGVATEKKTLIRELPLAQAPVSPLHLVLVIVGIHVAGGGIVLLLWFLARKLFPIPAVEPLDPPFTTEEGRSWVRWGQVWFVPRFLVLWFLLTVVWYVLLFGLASLVHRAGPGTLYLLTTLPLYWSLPAMFLGLLSSIKPMDWLCRSYLGDRLHRYERFCMGLSRLG